MLLGGACSTSMQFSTETSRSFARWGHRISRNRRKRRSRLPEAVFQMRKSSTRRRALCNSGHYADARPHAARGPQPLRWCFSARGNSRNNSLHACFSGNLASWQIRRKLALTSACGAPPDWSDADHDFITVKSWQLKDWSVIYFYPKDFTFICPTEIVGMDNLMSETNEVYGISPDNEYCKWNWKTSDEHQELYGTIHPLLADCNNVLAEKLGIVSDEGVPYRATYIVDPEGIIQHVSINALNTGRNANEILRTLQALKAGGLTGCEWNPGEDFVA